MNIAKIIFKYIAVIVFGSVLYLLSFHVPFLNFTGIYFYDGILRLILVCTAICVAIALARKKIRFDWKDVCLCISTLLLLNMLWLSLCIVSLDRSLSVFLLCYMDKYTEGMDREQIDEAFQDVFVEKYGMLERRFDEQIKSGNVIYENGKYKLTKRGELFVWIFKTIGKAYHVDERFIDPVIESSG